MKTFFKITALVLVATLNVACSNIIQNNDVKSETVFDPVTGNVAKETITGHGTIGSQAVKKQVRTNRTQRQGTVGVSVANAAKKDLDDARKIHCAKFIGAPATVVVPDVCKPYIK